MKKNIPLIIGIALPISLVIILYVFVIYPRQNVDIKGEIVYTSQAMYASNFVTKESIKITFKNIDNQIVPVAKYYTRSAEIDKKGEDLPYPFNKIADYKNSIKWKMTDASWLPPLSTYDVKTGEITATSLGAINMRMKESGVLNSEYTIGRGRTDSGIFEIFGGNRYNDIYLYKKGEVVKPLTILSDMLDRGFDNRGTREGNWQITYSNEFTSLGWVK